jgi:chitodextrinase
MFDLTSTDDKTRLIAPPVNFGPYTTAELTFWHCMQEWAPNQDELRVYYKTSAGGAWNLLAGYSTNVAGWTKRTISLPDLGATYYVAFEGNARRGNGICLDDVLIMGAGTNPPPDLSAPSVPAGLFMLARTTNSVTIGWGASTDNVGVVGYKVYRNGAQVGNVAGLSFTNQGLTPGCGYTNQVRAYDAAGNTSALSAALAVFPLQAVTITLQPQSCTNKAGSAVNFLVGANGTAPICYQWQKDGVNVPGATNALYSIAAVPAGAAGGYRCLVSNVVGVVTSATATLTVHSAPVITSQPVAQSVAEGQAVLFSVGVSGTAPFGFQWRKDDAGLVGAVASNYQIAAAAAGHAGAYYCVVTNVAGAVTSQAAILTVNAVVTNTAPTITLQPQSATVNPGAAVAFSVTAGGSAPLAYQWQKNGTSIFGANSSRYAIKAAAQAHEGAYRCLVQNAAGVATSAVATLTVNDPPAITSQPQPQRVRRGAPASFTLTATGLAPLTYQWRKDGVVLDGAITPQYTLAAAERSDAGGYDCVVQNALGAVTSVVARLTIKACNGDLDGDGLADPWLVRDSRWYCWPSAQGYQRTGPCELGIAGTPVVADFDGDGRADLAMVTGAGQWYLWYSAAAYRLDGPYELGLAGLPVAEDVDGDGKADPALLRDNRWYLWMSAADYLRDGPYDLDQVGTPLLGDFDGDGKADPALITGDGTWYVWGSDFEYRLGGPSALGVGGTPLCGDFDGDGLADPVIIDAEGYWHVWWSSNLYQHAGPYVLP